MSEIPINNILPLKRKKTGQKNHLHERLGILSKSRFPKHKYLAKEEYLYMCAKYPPKKVKDLSDIYSKYFLNEDYE
jgi:hypothetical protein